MADHWLPGHEQTEDVLGKALFLERNYWKTFEAAVANGITKAFKG